MLPVDPTADLSYGSEVSVIVDEGAFLDMDQTEFVNARCEPASMPRARQEGAQYATSEIREMRSLTGSLQWVTGETRQDELFTTIQLQRKQSALLVSDHKRVVQTIKRVRRPLETGSRYRPRTPKLCVLVSPDSALHKADADTDDEGSDDGWWTKAKQKVLVCGRTFLHGRFGFFGSFVSWRTCHSA